MAVTQTLLDHLEEDALDLGHFMNDAVGLSPLTPRTGGPIKNLAALAVDAASVTSVLAAPGERFLFETSTTMAAPGTGGLRFNNATIASVTAIAFNASSAYSGNPDISDFIATWGASTSTDARATLVIRKIGSPGTFAIFKITAVIADNTTWLRATVAYVRSVGAFIATDNLSVEWTRTGDAGDVSSELDVDAIAGQSNAAGTGGDIGLSPTVPSGYVLQYSSGVISDANEPVGPAIPAGPWPSYGIAYNAATSGRRLLLVNGAEGGTDMTPQDGIAAHNWAPSGTGATLAPALVANTTAAMVAARAAGFTPKLRRILWVHGENPASAIGGSTVTQPFGSTTTAGPYSAGTTSIVVASATGIYISATCVITLDNGDLFATPVDNLVGTTVTLHTGVPVGRSILNGARFHMYTQEDYRVGLQNTLAYFRSTPIDGVVYPQLDVCISLTGGPQGGDSLGYQRVRQAQEQVAASDPYTHIVFRGAKDFIRRDMMQTGSLHYKQEGYNEMGRRMAASVVSGQSDDAVNRPGFNVSRVVLGGTLRNADQLLITVTSSGLSGSPWGIGPVTVATPGDTFASVAAQFVNIVNTVSPNMGMIGMFATSYATPTGAVIEFYEPDTNVPKAAVTASWTTSGATETVSITTGRPAHSNSIAETPITLGAPGYEYTASLASGSAVSLTTATATTILSMTLPAGTYDIGGTSYYKGGATTTVLILGGQVSTGSNISDLGKSANLYGTGGTMFNNAFGFVSVQHPTSRFVLTAPTTINLNGYAEFSVSTASVFGAMRAVYIGPP